MPSAIIYLVAMPGILASQGSLALSPNSVLPSSTTTLGEPLQFTRSLPESTTTLGAPLKFTRTPESTTTLGEPLMATRSTLDTVAIPHFSTQGLNSSATLPSVHTRSGPLPGWAGFFKNELCSGDKIAGDVEIANGDCHQMSRPAGAKSFGILTGNGHVEIQALFVFSDKSCSNRIHMIAPRWGLACFGMGELGIGPAWGSVRGGEWEKKELD